MDNNIQENVIEAQDNNLEENKGKKPSKKVGFLPGR